MSVFRFWSQQDSNPRPGYYHADVLPLHHFDPRLLEDQGLPEEIFLKKKQKNKNMFSGQYIIYVLIAILNNQIPAFTSNLFQQLNKFINST